MAVRTPRPGLPARPRLLAPALAVAALVLVLGGVFVSLYTDLLWFREVGFTEVFSTVLRTRLLLFVGFGLLMAVIVGANLAVAYRVRPPFRPMSLEQQNLERYRMGVEPFLVPLMLLVSGVLGLFAGLSAGARWQTWLLWRNRTDFGITDEQFGRDVAYYAMTYPFQRFVLGFLLTAVVLSLITAAATHYLFGGLRLQTAGEKVSPAARAHLSVLVGVIVLLKAVAYYLDRFGLVLSEGGRVQGATFTDINAVLPAKNILIFVAIICALLFFANIVVRNILLPGGALALLVLSAVVLGGLFPAYTQQFRVKPNELERERDYIGRNIDATRAGVRHLRAPWSSRTSRRRTRPRARCRPTRAPCRTRGCSTPTCSSPRTSRRSGSGRTSASTRRSTSTATPTPAARCATTSSPPARSSWTTSRRASGTGSTSTSPTRTATDSWPPPRTT